MALFVQSSVQATNNLGNPVSGAKWKFFLTGTTTPATVYADADLTTPLGVEVTANSSGWFVPIYLDDAVIYRAKLTTSAGATIGSNDIDPISRAVDILGGDPAAPNWSMFLGEGAGDNVTSGIRNTLIGAQAGAAVTSGDTNTAVGSLALNKNTTGSINSAFGADALSDNTTGAYNDAFGVKALTNNISGSRNAAFGQSALLASETGDDNCAFGHAALITSNGTSANAAFGVRALNANSTGNDNCAFGIFALFTNTTASGNSAFGRSAMYSNTTGDGNSALGYQSMYSNTTGSNNTALGQIALYANTTGSGNTGVGLHAGYGAAGDERTTVDTNCTFVGHYASRSSAVPTATVLTNSTAIGNDAKFTKSNQVSLGNDSVTEVRAPGPGFLASTTNFTLSKTSTAGGTTGAQTINKPAGSVNFAAAATSLVVTNSLVTASSVIIATVATNDSTMKSVAAVAGSGSFTLHANAAATAETRVSFLVIN